MVRIIPTPPRGPHGEPWYLDDPPPIHPDPEVEAQIEADIFYQVRWLCGEIEGDPEIDELRDGPDPDDDEAPGFVCGTPELIEQEQRQFRNERERARGKAARGAEPPARSPQELDQGDLFSP
jgi:hypothetical protein